MCSYSGAGPKGSQPRGWYGTRFVPSETSSFVPAVTSPSRVKVTPKRRENAAGPRVNARSPAIWPKTSKNI